VSPPTASPASTASSGSSASGLTRALHQVRYEQKAFWRNPAAAFFTFAFPLVFLVIFTALLGNDTSTLPTGREVSNATYYTGSILAFSVITATYTNLAMSVTFSRDEGILKRIRGTPLPPWAYLLARVLNSAVITAILIVIVLVFGRIFYDIALPGGRSLAFIVTMVVGGASFCALGLALTGFIPNADAAPAVVNASILPLLFLSGVFIPIDDGPAWIRTMANLFPVRHFLVASLAAFLGPGSGWRVGDLAVVALWGVAGLLIAVRFFSWEPRR
jgi:ABC-2 type transport system permease protein